MTTQSTQASPRTTLTAVDPSTGAVVREVPAASPDQIDAVLDRARALSSPGARPPSRSGPRRWRPSPPTCASTSRSSRR
ncbi:hypothetical protein [Brachybacterium sp. GPGPB12]|uniref:hypothetical protein n=1 Tax=Brachybacterium sp. GPGPB12 TaxID=3023517 RepID=UPI003134624A